jgi:beta-mannosidase
VEHKEWWYRLRFKADLGLRAANQVRLVAEGLDTWCTLWLNGARLGRTETMFVEHTFEVGGRLKAGTNELLLRFESPMAVLTALEKKHGYRPAIGEDKRMHGRKAQCSFGWDWGPRLPTSGIFKPIRLEAPAPLRVADLWVRTRRAGPKTASGELNVEIEAAAAGEAPLELRLGDWEWRGVRRLAKGLNRFKFNWTLDRPRLWWPQGWGEAHLYRAEARVGEGRSHTLDVGIRTVALDRRKDAAGESFGFKVNGKAIFAKGANWIPADSFLGRLDAARVLRLVELAAEANYTMLRVWGGGVFESEDFYRACDRLGILVWQDFLFSCSEVPEHPDFLRLVAAETKTALRRLRRHPSLALLCGNNENHMARHDGWFKGRRSKDWGRALYHDLLPPLCADLAPGVPYWPGSPFGGKDPNSQGRGDRHHWLAWAQWKDPDVYLLDKGRFISEFGLAALPSPAALKLALGKSEPWVQGPALVLHDKVENGSGLSRLACFVFRHLPYAAGLDRFRYLTQVFQSQGLSLGIEHWRRLKPHTQGALVWQHNDCWPVVSWALLDSLDTPKLAYHGVKRAFDDVLLSSTESKPPVPLPGRPSKGPLPSSLCEAWLTLDTPLAQKGRLRVERWNIRRLEAVLADIPCAVAANASRRLWSRSRKDCGITDSSRQYLVFRFTGKTGLSRRSLLFFERPVGLAMEAAGVLAGARAKGEGIEVAVRSKALALACEVSAPVPGAFSDNGFDLLPGETRVLRFKPSRPGAIRGPWAVKTLNQMGAESRRMEQ